MTRALLLLALVGMAGCQKTDTLSCEVARERYLRAMKVVNYCVALKDHAQCAYGFRRAAEEALDLNGRRVAECYVETGRYAEHTESVEP